MTQLTELDYESIENSVMETTRGRWFLAEHKKRHNGIDTPAILDAIARLEKVMTSINIGEPDIPKSNKVSAVPLALNIPSAAETSPPEPGQLSDENLQFFKNDEDLFAEDTSSFLSETPAEIISKNVNEIPEPVETSKPVETPEPRETSEPDRERFKIFKKSSQDEQAAATQPETTKNVPDPTLNPTTQEQDRIIVIRSASGADIDIPLADEFDDAPETEQPASSAS